MTITTKTHLIADEAETALGLQELTHCFLPKPGHAFMISWP